MQCYEQTMCTGLTRDQEPSTTAKPTIVEVKTGEGYHIVMVEGRK